MKSALILITALFFCCFQTQCQKLFPVDKYERYTDSIRKQFVQDTSSFKYVAPGLFAVVDKHPGKYRKFLWIEQPSLAISINQKNNALKKPLLKVHGNIYYDVFYQSNVDTPFYDRDIYQHTIRTYLDIIVKDDYPVRIGFSMQFSNSSMLRNIKGLNFQFNNQEFKNRINQQVEQWLLSQSKQDKVLKKLAQLVQEKEDSISNLKSWLSNPSILQKLVEEKENKLFDRKKDTAVPNSTYSSSPKDKKRDSSDFSFLSERYTLYQHRLDTLTSELDSARKEYQNNTAAFRVTQENLKSRLVSSTNSKTLMSTIQTNAIPDSILPKGYKTLMAIRSFSVGRTVLNYSELTAKNVTINGVQIEYNPSSYYAVAIGYIDYRYREYMLNIPSQQKQYLNILRYGKGLKDGNNIIFTVYQGKKQLYNYVPGAADTILQPYERMAGIAIEGNIKIATTTSVTLEVAKSALPDYNRNLNKQGMWASALTLTDHSNEAYSFRVQSYIPKTGTKLAGSFKHLGANFQSFSLFKTNSAQSVWYAKIEQPLFKRKLNIAASVKTNDFTNPYLNNQFYSKTIFKSIQATINIRKLPVISVGYFPSSQLIKLSADQYTETLFYSLTGYISHFYQVHATRMNTYLSYARFYNRQSDSSFVYFNTQNWILSHAIYLKRWTFNGTLSRSINISHQLYSVGAAGQIKINAVLQLGGGIKYNKESFISNKLIGYHVNGSWKIQRLGSFQLYLEKGYIPGPSRQLVPNNTGRLSYFKIF